MMSRSDQKLDKFFRDRLKNHELPYHESYWEKMEQKLDENSKGAGYGTSESGISKSIYILFAVILGLGTIGAGYFLLPGDNNPQEKTSNILSENIPASGDVEDPGNNRIGDDNSQKINSPSTIPSDESGLAENPDVGFGENNNSGNAKQPGSSANNEKPLSAVSNPEVERNPENISGKNENIFQPKGEDRNRLNNSGKIPTSPEDPQNSSGNSVYSDDRIKNGSSENFAENGSAGVENPDALTDGKENITPGGNNGNGELAPMATKNIFLDDIIMVLPDSLQFIAFEEVETPGLEGDSMPDSSPIKKGSRKIPWSYGFSGGVNLAKTYSNISPSPGFSPSLFGGIFIDYKLKNNFFLSLNPVYIEKRGQELEKTSTRVIIFFDTEKEITTLIVRKLQVIHVPLLLGYQLNDKHRFHAGPYANFLINTLSDKDVLKKSSRNTETIKEGNIKGYTTGIAPRTYGAILEYRFYPRENWNVFVRYSQGLTDVVDDEYFNVSKKEFEQEIFLGISFRVN